MSAMAAMGMLDVRIQAPMCWKTSICMHVYLHVHVYVSVGGEPKVCVRVYVSRSVSHGGDGNAWETPGDAHLAMLSRTCAM